VKTISTLVDPGQDGKTEILAKQMSKNRLATNNAQQSWCVVLDPMGSGALTKRRRSATYCVLAALALSSAARAEVPFTCSPANHATRINPDTHLVLTFSSPPTLGKSGQIRIYDAAGHHLVDTLDLSIPAGPDPARRLAAPPAGATVLDPAVPTSPTTTTPAVRTTPADLHNYQLTTIGGLADFHFYPVIVHGNVATIYPHNHVLRYNHKYIVRIDSGIFTPATGVFAGFTTDHAWRFTTKQAPPRANTTRVVVADDGSGDFNTVQGAVDFVPDNPPNRVTVFIKNGTYEEIVFFRNKANLTFRGEDRDKVQVGYGNNSGFNPPQPGPNRRCAFSAYDSTGIEFINFTLNNYFFGQAEALLISGSKNVVSHMNIKGSGDALNLRGSVYLTDSTVIGDGDTILGVGPAFFRRCEIQSVGPFMWIRNTEANHGNVFVDCTFTTIDRPRPLNRAPAPVALPACSRACPTITASTTPTPRPCSSTAASKAFRQSAGDPSTTIPRTFTSGSSTAPMPAAIQSTSRSGTSSPSN
jgi:hypothetical protein